MAASVWKTLCFPNSREKRQGALVGAKEIDLMFLFREKMAAISSKIKPLAALNALWRPIGVFFSAFLGPLDGSGGAVTSYGSLLPDLVRGQATAARPSGKFRFKREFAKT
jgi:hypothetical protein